MIPQYIKVVDFMAYREASIDLSGVKLACLYGDNGAGKSTLIDAITWALWGKARAKSDDDIVRQGAGQASVDLYFTMSGVEYHVWRTRKISTKTGVSALFFEARVTLGSYSMEPSRNLTGATIKDTQEMIEHILRMSYSTFCNSAFLRQGHSDEFTIRPPGERKQVLGEILDLAEYQNLEAIAKERARSLRWEVEKIQVGIDGIGTGLDVQIAETRKDIDTLQAQRTELQAKIPGMQTKLEELRDVRTKAQAALEALNEAKVARGVAKVNRADARSDVLLYEGQQSELSTILGQQTTIEQRYAEYGKAEEELATMDGKLAELHKVQEKKARLEGVLAREKIIFEGVLGNLKQQMNSLQAPAPGICPTCGQTIGQDIEQKLEAEANELRTEILQLAKKIEDEDFCRGERRVLLATLKEIACLQVDTKGMPALKQRITELKGADIQMSKLDDAKKRLPTLDTLLSEKRAQVTTFEQQIAGYDAKIKAIGTPDGLDLDQRIDELSREVEHWQRRDRELGDEHARLKASVEQMEEQVKRMVVLQQTHQELASQVLDYNDLANAFGKTGVQALIIETAIPTIEVEANRLLGNMSGGRMSLALETQRATKTTDSVKETLDIEISDELGTRPYEMYSGGEAFRINLALRIAMSRLLANRAGAPLPTLIIDEGFGNLDQDGLSSVISTLHAAEDEFDLVLVITHLEQLRENFPTQIRVRKEATGSVVSIQ